jgi:hypothetical protein
MHATSSLLIHFRFTNLLITYPMDKITSIVLGARGDLRANFLFFVLPGDSITYRWQDGMSSMGRIFLGMGCITHCTTHTSIFETCTMLSTSVSAAIRPKMRCGGYWTANFLQICIPMWFTSSLAWTIFFIGRLYPPSGYDIILAMYGAITDINISIWAPLLVYYLM